MKCETFLYFIMFYIFNSGIKKGIIKVLSVISKFKETRKREIRPYVTYRYWSRSTQIKTNSTNFCYQLILHSYLLFKILRIDQSIRIKIKINEGLLVFNLSFCHNLFKPNQEVTHLKGTICAKFHSNKFIGAWLVYWKVKESEGI